MASPGLPESITAGVTTGHVTDHEKIHDLLNEFDSAAQAQATGDLLVFQDGLIKRLPVGSDNQVLTADSTQPAGVKWATPTGGGGGGGEINLALGRPYTTSPAPNHVDGDSLWLGPSDSDYQTSRNLTDGIRPNGSGGSFGRAGCISWQNQNPTITFDFGSSVAVTQVRVFGAAGGGGIVTPDRIIVESSPDNSVWTSQADTGVLAAGGSSASGMRWAITMDVNASARYWRLLVTRGGEWTAIGEVEIIGVN